MSRLYFRDNENNNRCVEADLPFGVDDQKRLQAYVNVNADIKVTLPILEAIEPGKFGKETQNERGIESETVAIDQESEGEN